MIIEFLEVWNYWIVFILMMIGLYIVISKKSLLKKIVGLAIFQTSVFLLYITLSLHKCNSSPEERNKRIVLGKKHIDCASE